MISFQDERWELTNLDSITSGFDEPERRRGFDYFFAKLGVK
jgi:hypothetical protein